MPAPTIDNILAVTSNRPRDKAQNTDIIGIRQNALALRRMVFHLRSHEAYSSPFGHLVTVKYPLVSDLRTADADYPGLNPGNARVRLFCSCPAWQYYGPAYYSTRHRWRLHDKPPEYRPPDIRDPNGDWAVCKHVVKVANSIRNATFSDLARLFNIRRRRGSTYTACEVHDHQKFDITAIHVAEMEDIVEDVIGIVKEHLSLFEDTDAHTAAQSITADQLLNYGWQDTLTDIGLILP